MGSPTTDQRQAYIQAIRNMAEAWRAVAAVQDQYIEAIQMGSAVTDQVAGWRQRVLALARLIEEEQLRYRDCLAAPKY